MKGYGYKPYFVEGSEPEAMHQQMAETLDTVIAEIKQIQDEARSNGNTARPRWPMIVLRSPKGWTGPKEADGVPIEGTWRSHQVPMADFAQEARARQAAGRMDEELQAGGALRRERHADSGIARAAAEGRPPHGGQSACQRRPAAQGASDAGFPGLRRGCSRARGCSRGADTRARLLPARRDEDESGPPQLPGLRTR